jgi:hypothetical protein
MRPALIEAHWKTVSSLVQGWGAVQRLNGIMAIAVAIRGAALYDLDIERDREVEHGSNATTANIA